MDSGVLFTVFMPAQPHLSPTDVVDYLMCWYFLRAPHIKVHVIPTHYTRDVINGPRGLTKVDN